MNNRRNFLKTSAFAATALVAASSTPLFASTTNAFNGIVYTKDNPGKYGKKVGSHAPEITVEGGKVAVKTNHGMSEKHFIVRHTLVLADGTVVGAKTFTPESKPESSYDLPAGYKGKVYATSFCNLHDLWLTETTA